MHGNTCGWYVVVCGGVVLAGWCLGGVCGCLAVSVVSVAALLMSGVRVVGQQNESKERVESRQKKKKGNISSHFLVDN